METDLNNPVSFSAFTNVTLIDIVNDRVCMFSCKNKLELIEKITYEEYVNKLKKVIDQAEVNTYFEKLSLNKLKESGGDPVLIPYTKLSSNLSYESYVDIAKVLEGDVICVFTVKGSAQKQDANEGHSEDAESSELAIEIADFIYNAETIFNDMNQDQFEVRNSVKYLTELMDDFKKKGTVLEHYRNKVTVEVSKKKGSVLIADDDSMMRNILKKVFTEEYEIIEAKNGQEAIDLIAKNYSTKQEDLANPINIVGMFLDLKMPVLDGFGVLKYMEKEGVLGKIPVIIVSADDAKDTKERVYDYDIADMIEKPFNYALIKKRIGKLINMYSKTNALKDIVRSKDTQIKKLLKGYSKAYLTDYAEVNHFVESATSLLVGRYLSKKGANLEIGTVSEATRYYDVGLNFVPKTFFKDVNNLSKEQRDILFNYPNVGASIVSIVAEKQSDSFIKYATEITKMHNERYDGRGFPEGIGQDKIPAYVYLANIAIDFVNLRQSGMSDDEIKANINGKSGSKFSPESVDIFNESFLDLKVIK